MLIRRLCNAQLLVLVLSAVAALNHGNLVHRSYYVIEAMLSFAVNLSVSFPIFSQHTLHVYMPVWNWTDISRLSTSTACSNRGLLCACVHAHCFLHSS